MAPVIAAIVAAILAGLVAFTREVRLELRRLLVAARLTSEALSNAQVLCDALNQESEKKEPADWSEAQLTGELGDVWNEHKDVLADRLTNQEWLLVSRGINAYRMMVATPLSPALIVGRGDTFRFTREALRAASFVLEPYCSETSGLRTPGARRREEALGKALEIANRLLADLDSRGLAPVPRALEDYANGLRTTDS